MKGDPNIERYSFYVGQGAVRFYLPLNVQLANDYFAEAIVVTKGIKEREEVRARLQKALESEFANLNTRISALELGPPSNRPGGRGVGTVGPHYGSTVSGDPTCSPDYLRTLGVSSALLRDSNVGRSNMYNCIFMTTKAGTGASHQTGWTGLLAPLIEIFGHLDAQTFSERGRAAAFDL